MDKAMIYYKGTVFFRQHMPNKPIKWSIKVWMLADAKQSFVSNFEVYVGKAPTNKQAEHGHCPRVLLHLSKPFHHSKWHLYFDNLLNSQVVADELLKLGLYSCGALNVNCYPHH